MAGAEIAYIDESYDQSLFAMSALIIPTHAWRDSFDRIQTYRRHLKSKYGIFTSKELHATDFVAGRGRISSKTVPKGLRAFLFRQTLTVVASLPGAAIISGAWGAKGHSHNVLHEHAFARIQERLQRRCVKQDSQMLLFVDEGKEQELQRVARRTSVWNPVASQFGTWEDGSTYKNIPNDRLIEDPVFKPSDQSYFLQAADFIAFALLKSEVPPTPLVQKHKLHEAYNDLAPICATEASRKDPRGLGILRT
jgi:hypothetical protein